MSAFKDWLNSLTSKTTPVDADELYVRDSSGTPGSKKLTWANLKATLLAYFDTAYLKLTGGTLAGGTVTASSPVLTTTQTWNNAGVAFVGKTTNITNTASSSSSLIESWSINSSDVVKMHRDGGIQIMGAGSFEASGGSGFTMQYGTTDIRMAVGGFYGNNIAAFGWASSADSNGTKDTLLYRDAAGIIAQRNGTNAQTYRNYGTYTDASNYRRVAIAMTTAGVASITPEGAGTGASGNVLHISGLPTSDPGAGILWNDSGKAKV